MKLKFSSILRNKKFIFYLTEIISKGLNILLIFILPFIIDSRLFSSLSVALTFEIVLTGILIFGQDTYLLRNLIHSNEKRVLIIKSYLMSFMLYGFFLLFSIIIISLNAGPVGSIINDRLFLLILSCSFAWALINIKLTFLRVVGFINQYNKLRLLTSVIKFSLIIFVSLIVNREQAVFFIYTILSFLLLSIFTFLSRKVSIAELKLSVSNLLKHAKVVSKFGLFIIVGLWIAYYDRAMVSKYLTTSDTSKFFFNNQIILASFVIPNLLALWLMPIAYKFPEQSKKNINRFLVISVVFTLAYDLIFHFFGVPLIEYRFDNIYLMDNEEYLLIYGLSVVQIVNQYFHFIFVWKNRISIETYISVVIFAIIIIVFNFLHPVTLFSFMLITLSMSLLQFIISLIVYVKISRN